LSSRLSRLEAGFLLALGAAFLPWAAPAPAHGQEDRIPDPAPVLDGPHDPFNLGFAKTAYTVGLKLEEVFDDNVFLAADGQESDSITMATFTARVRHDYGSGAAHLNYLGRQRQYARFSELDGDEHLVDGAAGLDVSNFKFEAGFEWRELKDPVDVLQSTDRFDSQYDREYLKATGDFGRFDVELRGALSRFTADHEFHDRGDYRRSEASATGLVEAWSQVALLGEIGYRQTLYDEDHFSDFTIVSVFAGARGSLTPKTRTEVKVGYARAEPAGDSVVEADEFTGFVGSLTTTWTMTEKQEFRIELRREPVESYVTGLELMNGALVGYKFTPTERLTAESSLGWEERRETDGGRRSGLRAGVGAQWTFAEKIVADVGAVFRTRYDSDPASEFENLRISIGIGVNW